MIFLLVGKVPGYICIRLQIIVKTRGKLIRVPTFVLDAPKTFTITSLGGHFIITSQIQFDKENPAKYE